MNLSIAPTTPTGRAALHARFALRAPEDLTLYNRAGYVRAGDVHVATRLAQIAGEDDPRVRLATALLVRVVRDGSTCLRLADAHELEPEVVDDPSSDDVPAATSSPQSTMSWPEPEGWAEAVAASPLVAAGVLRFEDGLLYLDRYWAEERSVCADLLRRRAVETPPVDDARLRESLARIFPAEGYTEQQEAVARLVHARTGVLTGGPGSGKTTTVAGLLAVLTDVLTADGAPPPRIALTAPTGKAAARLQEAVSEASKAFPEDARERLAGLEASTLHRLLGWRPGSRTRFRHDRSNTLPHDVVVVDESSMLSLTLTSRLLEALRPTTRLVLVGDADQLASVDAGAVLGDLVGGVVTGDGTDGTAEGGRVEGGAADRATADAGIAEGDAGSGATGLTHRSPATSTRGPAPEIATVVRLTGSHRYSGAIGDLARAVRAGDADTVLRVLRSEKTMRHVEDPDDVRLLQGPLTAHAVALREAARAGDRDGALELLGRHRVLCAHRSGPYGVRTWNRRVEAWVTEETGDALYDPMYLGRPLLVTTNDYGLGLHNGDTGVVVAGADPTALPVAVLAGAGGPVTMAASRLSDVETMHAMTVHKAQGSEADDITVILPPGDSALLTRELLYTAVTRARSSVTVVGPEQTIRDALTRRARRASGLAGRLRAR